MDSATVEPGRPHQRSTRGTWVEKDKTVLFEIDRAQFEADLNKAKADVALSKKGATRTDLPEMSSSKALLSRPTAAE